MESYTIESVQSFFERNNIQANINAKHFNKKNMCINIRTIGLNQHERHDSRIPLYTCARKDIKTIFKQERSRVENQRKASTNLFSFGKGVLKDEYINKDRNIMKKPDNRADVAQEVQKVFEGAPDRNSEIPPIQVRKYKTPSLRQSTSISSVANILPNVKRTSVKNIEDYKMELGALKGLAKKLNKNSIRTESSRQCPLVINSSVKSIKIREEKIFGKHQRPSQKKSELMKKIHKIPALKKICSLRPELRNNCLRDKRHSMPKQFAINHPNALKGGSSIIKKQQISKKKLKDKETLDFKEVGPWESGSESYSDF
ncbi:unnamed protein product [Moneuplotes crassus]|uniref:Uncharacterized protein n=1 Tax=Euplotes crassus TaxID=5936 RepID=A0AAD1UHM1_EUPCR|nr:unnamed protein product [Moneuplotes crassus]